MENTPPKFSDEENLRKSNDRKEGVFFEAAYVKAACSNEKQKVRESLDSLTKVLQTARLNILKMWNKPPEDKPQR